METARRGGVALPGSRAGIGGSCASVRGLCCVLPLGGWYRRGAGPWMLYRPIKLGPNTWLYSPLYITVGRKPVNAHYKAGL